jgi:hypothetical protein
MAQACVLSLRRLAVHFFNGRPLFKPETVAAGSGPVEGKLMHTKKKYLFDFNISIQISVSKKLKRLLLCLFILLSSADGTASTVGHTLRPDRAYRSTPTWNTLVPREHHQHHPRSGKARCVHTAPSTSACGRPCSCRPGPKERISVRRRHH